ncbi:MAG: helix-turn-helix transcriptional regulator [Candidatus Tectomicrobia bacterium]
MPHTPHHQEDPKRGRSALIAEAVWKALAHYPDQEEVQQESEKLSTGALPQCIAQHMLQLIAEHFPPELGKDVTKHEDQQDDEPREDAIERSIAVSQEWIEHLLQQKGVMEAVIRVTQTYRIGNAIEHLEHALGKEAIAAMNDEQFNTAIDDYTPDDERATLLNTCAKMLTPVLLKILEAQIDAPRGKTATTKSTSTPPSPPLLLETYLSVIGAGCYQGTREAVAQGTFEQADGSPWPTAPIEKGTARGHIQLRPVVIDTQPFMPPEEIERWKQIMWRQREELSDLDTDTLDALSAIWLDQTRGPNDNAVANVDDLLTMRGLTRNPGGQGRRGGYKFHQRMAMLQSLARIQNLWLNMAELETYDGNNTRPRTRRRKPTKRAILSRAFVIKDLMGQVRLDGFIDVEQFIFQPGTVFAHFLAGPGRQTALLSAKALQYHPSRQAWEKRLTRYLSWQWRCEARHGNYLQPLRVKTLLEAMGQHVNRRRLSWQRERTEKTLDTIQEDKIIAAWQYAKEAAYWPDSTVLIEPPDRIREQYQHLEWHEKPKHRALPAPSALGGLIKHRRQELKLSQIQAAEHLGLNQGYYSRLERGKTAPSLAVRTRLEKWCTGEA